MYCPSFLQQRNYDMVRDSAIGPSTSTGKNVSAPIINIVPSKIQPNN